MIVPGTSPNYGPAVPFSAELHTQKYRLDGESFEQAMTRVARALQDNDTHGNVFRDILLNMRFMPAGRIQTAMGSPKNVTPYNCFVLPVEDSFVEGDNSIMDTALKAAATMRMGGGVGYDFSKLRPRGAYIHKLQSRSSGPMSFMEIFDAVCKCVASSGHRRGAQMGIMRCDHPDIFDFVRAKTENEKRLSGFNLSVAVTDEFMRAVMTNSNFNLRFGGEVYSTIRAWDLWDEIMRATWDWAEPGVIFIDRVNEMNNLWYCETLRATNPCQEQPLPDFGACLLGSFNLVKYLYVDKNGARQFDWLRFMKDIPPVVRAMDNVIDRAIYPLEAQRQEALSKRRMGLGICGLANAAEAMGHVYGSPDFIKFTEMVMEVMVDSVYAASSELAKEKGSFPLYDKEKYLAGKFIQSLNSDVREEIAEQGIRNSHLISIAPTGTISMCADNISSGIEPVFDYEFDRTVIEFDGPRKETVQDYGLREFGVRGKRAGDVSVKEHIDVLVAAQKYVDSSISKTCNVGANVSYDEFKGIYMDAWQRGAKGCATFRVNGKRRGVLEQKEEPAAACRIDPNTGKRDCD